MRLYSIELVVRQLDPEQPPAVEARLEVENGIPRELVEAEVPALLRRFADYAEQHNTQHHTHDDNTPQERGDENQ